MPCEPVHFACETPECYLSARPLGCMCHEHRIPECRMVDDREWTMYQVRNFKIMRGRKLAIYLALIPLPPSPSRLQQMGYVHSHAFYTNSKKKYVANTQIRFGARWLLFLLILIPFSLAGVKHTPQQQLVPLLTANPIPQPQKPPPDIKFPSARNTKTAEAHFCLLCKQYSFSSYTHYTHSTHRPPPTQAEDSLDSNLILRH